MKPSVETKKQFEGKLWIGQLYGVAKLSEGNKLHPRLAFVVLLGIFSQVMQFHGLSESWGNVASVCNSFAVFCLVLQLIVRLGSKFIRQDNKIMTGLLENVVKFYEKEENIPSHREILVRNLKVSHILLNGYLVLCFVFYCTPSFTAWIVSWYTGELILFTPIYPPFVDPKTLSGYHISSFILFFFSLLVYILCMTSEIIFMYFVYQCVPMVDVLCLKLQEFGQELIKVKSEKIVLPLESTTSTGVRSKWLIAQQKIIEAEKAKKIAEVEKELINLIKVFNSYNDYVRDTVGFIEFTTFAAMTLNAMAIAASMVVSLYYYKLIGGALMFILFYQVFVPCIQGTLVLNQKEKLLREIYEFPWYELSMKKQKMFLQLIHLCQNSNEFNVQIIGTIDMELFTDVMNGAYSYLMYLMEFKSNVKE